jgi:hypothetical protein
MKPITGLDLKLHTSLRRRGVHKESFTLVVTASSVLAALLQSLRKPFQS